MRDSKSTRLLSGGNVGAFLDVRRELLVWALAAGTEALWPSRPGGRRANETLFALVCAARRHLFLGAGGLS